MDNDKNEVNAKAPRLNQLIFEGRLKNHSKQMRTILF
jgi:hypothetical protein